MSLTTSHVAIVGAGIVGVSTAIWALREGFSVTLIDRVEPGEGTSYGNAGLLASSAIVPVPVPGLLRKAPRMALDPRAPLFLKWSYLPRLAPWLWRYLSHANAPDATARVRALLPLIGDSLADHQALAGGTVAEDWIIPCDYLAGYASRAAYEADGFAWDLRRQAGFEITLLEAATLRDYDPSLGPAIGCAARLGGHGRIADPGQYVKDLARHAQQQGARFIKAEVGAVLREGDLLRGLRVDGEVIDCDRVVVTAGIWSGPLAKDLGLAVPIAPESGFHLELLEPSFLPRAPTMVVDGKFVITPMQDRLRLAGMVGYLGLGVDAPDAPYEIMVRFVKKILPGLTWQQERRWIGHRPSMSDSCPMIGEVPGLPQVFVGFGHDHVGLTGGPRTGQILTQLMAGRRPNIDLSPFAPGRFG